MNVRKLLSDDPIAQTWSPQIRQTYIVFSQRLANQDPLTIRIGKGGLSYYKETQHGAVFVCHFNAAPRAQKSELGFADFRLDTLEAWLDLDATLQALQEAASAEVQVKVNKLWCSLHFPLRQADKVAELFSQHIVSKIK